MRTRSVLTGLVFVILALCLLQFSQTPLYAQGDPSDCTVAFDKTATPTTVDAGGITEITLSLQSVGDCSAINTPVDVILVIDRSGSMSGQRIVDAKDAAKSFVQQMNMAADQVGIVSFSSTGFGILHQQLTQDGIAAQAQINGIFADGMTNVEEGLALAEAELLSQRHIAGNAPVIVVLSDGYHNETSTDSLLGVADRIKQRGFRIISIGLGSGADEYQLRGIASSYDDYFYAPDSGQLAAIYQSIVSLVRTAGHNMTVTDTLSNRVTLLDGTFQGPVAPAVVGNTIVWQIASVPLTGLTLSYLVAMTDEPGTWPTNDLATADYVDSNGNPANFVFPVPNVTVRPVCGPLDLLYSSPEWMCQGVDTAVNLFGGGFFNPNVTIGARQLAIQAFSEFEIQTTAPGDLPLGVHDIAVTNQCNTSSVLPSAFTVYTAEPSVLDVRPREGYTDVPADVAVCSPDTLPPGTLAYIDVPGGTVALENQFQSSPYCVVGTIPVGPPDDAWKGLRTIRLETPCGVTSDDRNGTFRILPADLNDDLWGMGEEIWADPGVVAFLAEDIKLGAIVHRRGGKAPVPVTVRFYEGDPATDGILIGDGRINLLSPGIPAPGSNVNLADVVSGTSTSATGWMPSRGEGRYEIYAVIDPDNEVEEDIEDNNILSRTVVVAPPLPPEEDAVAPRVDALAVGTGTDADVTLVQNVALHAESTDFAQLNTQPSGVSQMLLVEYRFNEAANIWEPVQASDWMSFTTPGATVAEDINWMLTPVGGLRFMQAWTVDRVGNVSRFPYQRWFNYIRPCETVARNGSRVYNQDLQVGDILEVQVRPCQGDPDLYVWPPNHQTGQAPPYVSNQYHGATEYISFTATTAGVYQVQVYAYSTTSFDLHMEVQQGAGAATSLRTARSVSNESDKPQPSDPPVPIGSVPRVQPGSPPLVPDTVGSEPEEQVQRVFLPMTTK